ncbi:hypothetical protein BaRGS_00013936 [Batillaria attramentaria]|uniref:Uncharacterized protein n=1 Tax=Batillaria attramentaria TaxID=370345 RepID=A0ABD0L5V3_9CAEN
MPTTSQNQVIKKVSRQSRNAVQAYIPPHHKVFSFTGYQHGTDIRQRTLPVPDVNKQATFFSEMLSLAALPTHPGGTSDTMSADDIMSRLQNLGWRKEGAAVRRAELEKR